MLFLPVIIITVVIMDLLYRPKTLVPLDSIEAVHRAVPPLPFSTTTPPKSTTRSTSYNPSTNFSDACTAMDDSTGVYVYAPHPPSPPPTRSTSTDSNSRLSFECRQFPRSSGYPEDPAKESLLLHSRLVCDLVVVAKVVAKAVTVTVAAVTKQLHQQA